MPVVGIGTDLVDVDRFRRSLARTPACVERLFTDGERAYAGAARDPPSARRPLRGQGGGDEGAGGRPGCVRRARRSRWSRRRAGAPVARAAPARPPSWPPSRGRAARGSSRHPHRPPSPTPRRRRPRRRCRSARERGISRDAGRSSRPRRWRAIDAAAPEPVDVLIERAGAAVARAAVELLGGTYGRRVVVIAGKGNNGATAVRGCAGCGARACGCAVSTPPTPPGALPDRRPGHRRRLRHRVPRRVRGARRRRRAGARGRHPERRRRAHRRARAARAAADAHRHVRRPEAGPPAAARARARRRGRGRRHRPRRDRGAGAPRRGRRRGRRGCPTAPARRPQVAGGGVGRGRLPGHDRRGAPGRRGRPARRRRATCGCRPPGVDDAADCPTEVVRRRPARRRLGRRGARRRSTGSRRSSSAPGLGTAPETADAVRGRGRPSPTARSSSTATGSPRSGPTPPTVVGPVRPCSRPTTASSSGWRGGRPAPTASPRPGPGRAHRGASCCSRARPRSSPTPDGAVLVVDHRRRPAGHRRHRRRALRRHRRAARRRARAAARPPRRVPSCTVGPAP